VGKNKKLTENQIDILNEVGSKRKERRNREYYMVLFGVPESNAATDEERTKEDEATTFEILEEIGIDKGNVYQVKRFRTNSKKTTASKPLSIRVTFIDNGDIVLDTLKKQRS